MSGLVVYKASAGSGKTYVLVREFLFKCFTQSRYPSHLNLLAVTFTNKAAYEMRSRVISTLHSFSKKKKEPLFNYFIKRLNWSEKKLEETSKFLLSKIIHDYTNLSISTIDKFSYKILRDFSFELSLSSDFEVEIDDSKFSEKITEKIINDLGLNDSLTYSLLNFSNYKLYQNKSWDIELDLRSFIAKMLGEDTFLLNNYLNKITHSDIINEQKNILKSLKDFEINLFNYSLKIEQLISSVNNSAFYKSYIPKLILNIKTKKYKNQDKSIFSAEFRKNILESKWYSKKTDFVDINQIEKISDQLHSLLCDLVNYADIEQPNYIFKKHFYNSLFVLSIYQHLNEFILSYKEEKNFLNVSDFNRLISSFIQSCPVPFIYEKIGARYKHYFIDEFQDTSLLQWHNLIPLIHETTSSEGGSCLIVGDSKQSIYRWRGGDLKQFLELSNAKSVWNNTSIKQETLEDNWRSSKYIVEFNNQLFNFISSKVPTEYSEIYERLEQNPIEKDSGYVELSFVSGDSYSAIEESTLAQIMSSINQALDDGYSLSDITIITRKKKQIEIISEYLISNNISIYSSESLLLKNCPDVQFLINNFKILQKEYEFKSKVEVLNYLVDNNFILIKDNSKTKFIYDNAKCENDQWNKFLKSHNIDYNFRKIQVQTLYNITEGLCRTFNLFLKSPNYITSFLDVILDYSLKNGNSISDFLDWWNESQDKLSVSVTKSADTVELLTIHKSKGLEFPVVIFPFANWKMEEKPSKIWTKVPDHISQTIPYTLLPFTSKYKFWPKSCQDSFLEHDKDLIIDNVNLLYVTLTRAKNRLFIISNKNTRAGIIYKYFEEFMSFKNCNSSIYKYGNRKKYLNEMIKTHQFIIDNYISNSWKKRLRVKSNRIYNWESSVNKAINLGNLIHKLMSQVIYKKDLKNLNYDETIYIEPDEVKIKIQEIILNNEIRHLFNEGQEVIVERTIVDQNRNVWRPDRLVIHNSKSVSVLDYKTGDYEDSHKSQILNYKKLLNEMGYEKVTGYLVYIIEGKVIKY